MAGSDVIELEVFFDYLCPFVYRASVLLDNVGRSGGHKLNIGWRYFSLSQVNAKDDGWAVWTAAADERVRGRLAFKAAEAARRQGRFEVMHLPLLQARHRDRLDIDEVAVVEQVAIEAGLDLERFRQDVADPDILLALARDHQHAVSKLGVFGTPTFVFPDGASAYVCLSEAPEGTDAIRVFDRLRAIAADEPRILEIKRPTKPSPD
ncbi:MAG: DsbA family protein [Candidatus Dormiibacterota bacterium]